MTKSELQISHYREVQDIIDRFQNGNFNLYSLEWKLDDLYLEALKNNIALQDVDVIVEVYKIKSLANARNKLEETTEEIVDDTITDALLTNTIDIISGTE
jgi:hypothetical protein|tara:strand:- start:347 stop:646 length:300 start_codon:yes stop_codon:yes gene_type:complete